jgi:hypothetical protein
MKTDPGNRNGFALLMVILLLALLSGVVVQSLISARMSLRSGDERQIRLTLRAAALDAAWAAMRTGMKAGTASSEYQVFDTQTPPAIQSRTTLQGLQREALPPPLQRREVPLFGQYFTVTTRSSSGTRSCLSRGLACRLPTGTIRLLAWVELP